MRGLSAQSYNDHEVARMSIPRPSKSTLAIATAGLTIAGMGMWSTSANADNGITGTIDPGTLDTALTDASFGGAIPYSFSASTETASTTLSIEDLRGTGAGWKISVEASNLVSGADTIPNTGLSFSAVGNPVLVDGQAIDPTNGPLRSGPTTASLNSARELVEAQANYGEGSYTQALTLDVQIPALQDAGTYSGTFTITEADPDA